MHILYGMMAGCQVGRDPSKLAAYNYISLIVNTIQRKKRKKKTEKKHNIITPLYIYNGILRYSD